MIHLSDVIKEGLAGPVTQLTGGARLAQAAAWPASLRELADYRH
jgi:hypothetical protein